MPGIVGLITKKSPKWAESQLASMLATMRHESFYKTGTLIEPCLGIYVGWVVREGSFSDCMPVADERGDVSVVFSGEEYSEQHALDGLNARPFDTQGPSRLLRLYEEDPNFVVRLNGLFHGLLVDRKRRTALLFNDRYGMHRLCYHQSQDAFYFAAEAKALLAALPTLREFDARGLGEFASCSCVLGDRTIFKNIYALPAASVWTSRDGGIEDKHTYFEPREWENQAQLDPESYYQELRDVFSRRIGVYFSDREQTGMTLTGGMDTRMIMAWHKPARGSLPCYTFGGMLRDCEDVRIARRIAGLCRQSHEVITIGREFLAKFPHYAERTMYLTEGGVDSYRATDLYVSEKARKIAPAKVVGTYGSEIVRHTVMFKATAPQPGVFNQEFLPFLRQAEDTYRELRREHPVTFAAFRQSPWYHQGILRLENSQLTVRSPYLDNDFVRTVFRAPQNDAVNGDVRLRLIREGSPRLGTIRTDIGYGGVRSLASSLSRVVLNFTFKAEYAYDYGMPQWLSRTDHCFSKFHFERLFLGRHKPSHFRIWYKGILADYVRDMLLDGRTLSRPYLDGKVVKSIVEGHTRQGLNYTSLIHKLLSIELLHRIFLDAR